MSRATSRSRATSSPRSAACRPWRPGTCEWACGLCRPPSAPHIGPVPSAFPCPHHPRRPVSAGCAIPGSRDVRAVTHHYDVGNDFYELVLGPSMTYSCARFADPAMSLEQAQESKHELICRKLGLREGKPLRLLDVGCGWGSMAMHAAANYGVNRRRRHTERGAGRATRGNAWPQPASVTEWRSVCRTTGT